MKKLMLVFAAAACLAACGAQNEAKEAIKKLLNDPDSAQFSDMQDGKNKGDVCGTVNAKNRMGGYVGKTPFFYEKRTEMAAIVQPVEDSEFRSLWLGIKVNNFADDLSKLVMKCRVADQWNSVCSTPLPHASHPMCQTIQSNPDAIYSSLKDAYDR